MNRLLLAFLVLLCQLPVLGAELDAALLADEPGVQRFYRGCLKIIEGEESTDPEVKNAAYAAAMDLLNTRGTAKCPGLRTGEMAVDSAGLSPTGEDGFAYSYAYARMRYCGRDFAPSGISRPAKADVRIFPLTLRPGAQVTLTENLRGDCMLLALAEPGAEITMQVARRSGAAVGAIPYREGGLWYARWDNGESSPVGYILTNPTDRDVYVMLISN